MTDLQRIWRNIQLGDDPSQTAPVCNGLVQEMIDEIESLRIQLKQAEERAEYAWKNTNTIEKERQRLEALVK